MDPLKQMGIRLWTAFGAWAPRRLAAIDYSMRYINSYPLPTGWDWAAKALDFSAPEPIIRGIPGGATIVIRTIDQTNAANATRQMLPTRTQLIRPSRRPTDTEPQNCRTAELQNAADASHDPPYAEAFRPTEN